MARSRRLDDLDWVSPHASRKKPPILIFMTCFIVETVLSLRWGWARTSLSPHLLPWCSGIGWTYVLSQILSLYSLISCNSILWAMLSIVFAYDILLLFTLYVWYMLRDLDEVRSSFSLAVLQLASRLGSWQRNSLASSKSLSLQYCHSTHYKHCNPSVNNSKKREKENILD